MPFGPRQTPFLPGFKGTRPPKTPEDLPVTPGNRSGATLPFTRSPSAGQFDAYLARVAGARRKLAERQHPTLPFREHPPENEPEVELPTESVRLPPVPEIHSLPPETNGDLLEERISASEEAAGQPSTSSQTRPVTTGELGKARDIIEAIRTLKVIAEESRPATDKEKLTLARFRGFGAVALSIFPDPVSGSYKDSAWQALGEELKSLLTQDEYASAKRTTFNAFYTSPVVMKAMFQALSRLGVSDDGCLLEPGCGIGNFISHAPEAMRFVGVELDSISGRIAKAIHPRHDIRIESFADTRLPDGTFDAAVGNPPFGDVRLPYRGMKLVLHDFFFAKSVDLLRPGGILALVTSHFTLDKKNGETREYLAGRADLLGAIRLPSDAFQREGTRVVTDVIFLRKRHHEEAPRHVYPDWLAAQAHDIEGVSIPINQYFLTHPEQVLGSFSRKDRLYGAGYSVESTGELGDELRQAVFRLPEATTPAMPAAKFFPSEAVFTPPALLSQLAEGSFFVRKEDLTICQIIDGAAKPVSYGGTVLKTTGTMTAKRLACLIDLRDLARRVLQSQNDGWPLPHREEARKALNRVYDLFHGQYGPINKTTVSASADGTVIRRMPNVVKFREDPDAMLVMALEHFDEATGKATKADILIRDVVGEAPPITTVASAEEGLLVSLNRRGLVDLDYIVTLYGKPAAQVVEELGDLIFQDPETEAWQPADQYLSGNVRAKLERAKEAGEGFRRNLEALEACQPEDLLPGEIDPSLGAPWIPEGDVHAFAAALFGVGPHAIRLHHLPKEALWTLDADWSAERSVAATSEYGTARANGAWLLELALNQRHPVIYDTIQTEDGEQRVVNQEETTAAREKFQAIKSRFKSWLFSDPDRTERLVRLYNDTFNNIRPRLFDGSHLTFPGMSQTIELSQHQADAVWRGMTSGNCLLAHVVGAGKTYTMCATGMKLKSAGLITKPMYVVPNHMLEQFAREFQQLYPNAKLLVATKDDLARERRKLLTAKVASSHWDGIIVTHSSFERIGMSRDFQERFLREQIAEYETLLTEHARGRDDGSRGHRNLIKTIEKQKARREERLKELLAEDKKDDGLVFDELSVDHLFIDEAQAFKNLECPTKMDRVSGIQAGGSERAMDLYMKCRYLDEKHVGHGVTFATGTPVSNTMVEMFTLQRFLDLEGLRSRGIEAFDAWAATFCEVTETMEISADGKTLKPRCRFAKFVNLPELQQLFRAFTDVQTADMLELPRPDLAGGKAQVISASMSEEQAALQAELVERYRRLRSERVDPRSDNALAITTDGRKLALDARLLSPGALDHEASNSTVSRH